MTPQETVRDDGSKEASNALICRYGSFVLATRDAEDMAATVELVIAQLDRDDRVAEIHPFRPDTRADHFDLKYPVASSDETSPETFVHLGAVPTVILRHPLCFEVRVPTRHQRSFIEGEDPPSDRYVVRWDGESILVAWTAAPTDPVPISGGHVVHDVLSDAVRAGGLDLYVQGCLPGCTYLFAHTTLRVLPAPFDQEPSVSVDDRDASVVNMTFPTSGWDTHALAELVYRHVRHVLHPFAQVKNLSLRILNAEMQARADARSLLELSYEAAQVAQEPFRRRVLALRRAFERHAERRTILSRLWLILADIELNGRHWSQHLGFLESTAREYGLNPLIAGEHDQDTPLLKALDTGFIRQVLEDVSRGRETRSLAVATAGGALAGGLVGAVVVAVLA